MLIKTDSEWKELLEKLKKECMVFRIEKKDGTSRDMICTLKPEVLKKFIENFDEKERVDKNISEMVTVYDMEKISWRVLRKEGIVGYRVINTNIDMSHTIVDVVD